MKLFWCIKVWFWSLIILIYIIIYKIIISTIRETKVFKVNPTETNETTCECVFVLCIKFASVSEWLRSGGLSVQVHRVNQCWQCVSTATTELSLMVSEVNCRSQCSCQSTVILEDCTESSLQRSGDDLQGFGTSFRGLWGSFRALGTRIKSAHSLTMK